MSGRRKLLSNSRRPVASGTGSSRSQGAPTQPPPYESPSCLLDDTAKRGLTEITSNRLARKYEDHLKQSMQILTSSIYSINERLSVRRNELEALATRRQDRGLEEQTEQEKLVARATEKLESEIPALSVQIEGAFRQIIDRQAELADDTDALTKLVSFVQTLPPQQSQRNRRRTAHDEDDDAMDIDDDEEPPAVSVIEMLRTAREANTAEYDQLSPYQKYAENNDYKKFKADWHQAYHDDDGLPLPDASAWFDRDGRPVLQHDDVRDRAADDDEDLIVEREIRSLKCPLTLRTMEEPYSSNKCSHIFEKSAIMEYLQQGPKNCPQTGCNRMLHISDFALDRIVLRRIKRAEQAERRRAVDTSDIEPDDADASVVQAGSRSVKKEKGQGRGAVEDADDA